MNPKDELITPDIDEAISETREAFKLGALDMRGFRKTLLDHIHVYIWVSDQNFERATRILRGFFAAVDGVGGRLARYSSGAEYLIEINGALFSFRICESAHRYASARLGKVYDFRSTDTLTFIVFSCSGGPRWVFPPGRDPNDAFAGAGEILAELAERELDYERQVQQSKRSRTGPRARALPARPEYKLEKHERPADLGPSVAAGRKGIDHGPIVTKDDLNQLADRIFDRLNSLTRSQSLSQPERLQLYTATEAAKLLRVSRSSLYKILTPVRISERGVRYRASDIAALIEKSGNQ